MSLLARMLGLVAPQPTQCPAHQVRQPTTESGQSSGCPVMHKAAAKASSPDRCPVVHTASPAGTGSEEVLNADNMMPAPNQTPAPGQTEALSTDRVESTIPRAGDESDCKWVYPSEQMFYNALLRKGKGDGVEEKSMSAVVAIHNNMNERAWKQVLEWEALHCDECEAPKLLRFVGRPDDLSVKARFKVALGLAPRPFDRHDWTVDRCGKEVRYILDYYDVAHKQREDRLPQLHDMDSVPSIEMDVRPALDSPGAAFDRLRMMVRSIGYPTSQLVPKGDAADAQEAPLSGAMPETPTVSQGEGGVSGTDPNGHATKVFEQCSKQIAELQNCDDERRCAQAHIGLTMCIAAQVCRDEADAFRRMQGSADADEVNHRFDAVEQCVSKWSQAARKR